MPEAKQTGLFTRASELKNAPRFHRMEALETCDMCDGREPAVSIGSRCLEATIETVFERMVDQGRFDDHLQKVLDRRLARASIPLPTADDHALIDEVSGNIRD